jgi:tetratricopeptide (TPR) repeat protein
LLVELGDVERDEHIQRIIQESEEATEEFREVLDDDSGGIEVLERRLRDKSLKIPLYCTECKRTYRYDLQQIFVSDNIRRSPIIGQVIECKGCGSLETYEQTDETKSIMSLEMVRAMTLDRSGVEDWREHTSIKFGPVAITVLGKKFDNRPEAYRYLLAELEKAPDNPDLNRRMGNIYSHGLRTDLALPYYEKAIRLNPEDMESVASIAQIHIDDERFADAIPYVESLASLCKAPEIDEDEAAEYFGPLLLYAKEIEENTGRRIRIFDTPGGELDISAISRDTGLQFVSFDLDDPNDYQLAFHTFRDGAVPRKVMDQWKRARSRAGAARSSSENPRLSLPAQEPIRKVKVGRNESCPCGSGKKYKRCCGR